mmetsp:Transcript_103249/g.321149  ORF Transcript_103249/g.321149 Transcript_103249/m.321149 type:complete len:228 (-) Transcript_103249:1440-2123(-)
MRGCRGGGGGGGFGLGFGGQSLRARSRTSTWRSLSPAKTWWSRQSCCRSLIAISFQTATFFRRSLISRISRYWAERPSTTYLMERSEFTVSSSLAHSRSTAVAARQDLSSCAGTRSSAKVSAHLLSSRRSSSCSFCSFSPVGSPSTATRRFWHSFLSSPTCMAFQRVASCRRPSSSTLPMESTSGMPSSSLAARSSSAPMASSSSKRAATSAACSVPRRPTGTPRSS